MSSEARFIRKHVRRAKMGGTLRRNPRDNYKRLLKAKVSDSSALFSGSPENPAISKEMVARKIEIKYCPTIYRVIIAHRDAMTRSY